MQNRSHLTRRDFLRFAAAGATVPFWGRISSPASAATSEPFIVGVNYPWVTYGHDFGENAWGHDGVITSGWTAQKYVDSQGFTGTRLSAAQAHGGGKSLCITANLQGQDAHRSQGEVYLDLRSHAPQGVTVPLDLTGSKVRCWVHLPPGASGATGAPNGLQVFVKSAGFYSWYSPWTNLESARENRWTEFTADLSQPPDFADPQFDPSRIVAVGVKIAINQSSARALKGSIYLDDLTLGSDPPVTFDFERLEVERDFTVFRSVLQQCPKRVVRVFVFADGRASPQFNQRGEVQGLAPSFFEDFDELLRIAQRQDLFLLPVLLDFHWLDTPHFEAGVQLGGHSDVVRQVPKRRAFLNRVLFPLARRYGRNPRIYAWEIVNEPEWAMREVVKDYQVGDPVSVEEMRSFVRLCTDTLHASTHHRVTVGSARRKWLSYWQGLGLDLYQFHWYDKFEAEEPFPWRPCADLGLDRPCIIGEVPTASTRYTAADFLRAACEGGYHGLLPWSYRAGDEFSSFSHARDALQEWCAGGSC